MKVGEEVKRGIKGGRRMNGKVKLAWGGMWRGE